MKEKDTERLWNANYTKVWVANFMIFFSFMLLTPLLPIYLSEQFAANKDTIGLVLFGYAVMALVARLFSGYIVDSFPRKTVLLLSFAVFTLFFVGYVAAGTLVLFAVVRTVHGMGITLRNLRRVAEETGAHQLHVAVHRSAADLSTVNNRSIYYGGCLYPPEDRFLIIDGTVKTRPRERVKGKQKVSLDRFFLVKGTGAALTMVCFAFSYGVMSTYVAIYGKETLGIEGGSGTFFLLLSVGLILSRLQGNKALRERRITYNASIGVCVSLLGYLLFAAVPNEIGYYGAALIIGLGNGHMYPAYQNMFVDLAPHTQRGTANSSILVSWDVGVGLGILLGGVLTENYGYGMAFWMAWVVNLVGFAGFWLYVKGHFTRNKLR